MDFENPEIKRKFEDELDIILQKRKPMGIREAIIEDLSSQIRALLIDEVKLEVKEELKDEVRYQVQKTTILNLKQKGFSNKEIAEIMNMEEQEVIALSKTN